MNVTCLLLAVAIQLECEQFEELGGWKVDSQFVGQMGSSYLLAHGLGHPVADARTSFECPESGSYCVCLRTMDWSSRWSDETAAGRYEVWIDGKPVGTANGRPWGGDAESGWHWQVGTRVDLAKGRHLLALRDLTGFDGRCDAVCLMTDGEPSRSSVTNSVAESDYDLVVAGGGIAGISASIAAARLGLRVALVQDRPVLGGNNSSEVRVHLGAYQNLPPYPRLGDVLAEYGPRAGGNARPAAQYEDERKLKAVRAEKNIALFLSTRVDGVSCEANGGRIEAVSARNVISGSRFRFRAPLFADCTGDGTVGFLSHADFRQGREARSEFGESLAPETADRMTMGASVQWYAVTNSCATGFPREPWMLPFSDRTARVGMRGDWDWETGLGRDQIAEAERIRDYGLLVAYSNWSYLKNGHAEKDRFRNADLEWVAYVAGKRESRRLLGDFILTEKHLDERDVQDDGTCVTTWTIDQHYPWPREVTGFCGEPFRAESRNKLIYPYPIPYRCFYSRNVPNLFMAGRDISVSHVALGTTRLMRTHGMMGEVVAMAASICRKHGCSPREVYLSHLQELKALMTRGVGDGKPHPRQDYNVQSSQDADIQEKYERNASLCVHTLQVKSPDGSVAIGFETDERGMRWLAERKGKTLVERSRLGLVFSAFGTAAGASGGVLGEMKVVDCRRRSVDEVWKTRLYRRETVRDRFNELQVTLEEVGEPRRRLGYVFRAYDEGVAFRYVIPAQDGVLGLEVLRELTEWRFPGKCEGWFTTYKGDVNGNEEPFVRRPMAEIAPDRFVGMPATVEVAGQCVALCEAALVNWAGLYYRTPKGGQPDGVSVFESHLTPLPPSEAATPGTAVICETPAVSPWRVMICADTQLDLIRKSDIIVNLNPPPEGEFDFSWVKPGASSWDWWVESNNSLSTEVTLKLVDFAAEMGWPYHTIDGGWYGFARRPNHGPNVRLEPRPGFDLKRIVEYAKSKGVGIWVWIHWEEINDVGVEDTFARLEKWGVKGVKTDFLDRQDQWMVNWYERVCRAAARHRIMVNFHGAFKPTGTERTWPNNLTREGLLGNEMNKFADSVTPGHSATLPFTRFLIGPGDFTPGSFANVYSKDFVPQVKKGHRYGDETDRCSHWAEEMGTRAHSIAQCVAFDGGLMTLCDWPERYRGATGVNALRRLPTTWKSTTPIAGVCGEYYAVVREAHDGRLYFATITVKSRKIDLKLDFLGDGEWTMERYVDDPEATPEDAKRIKTDSQIVRRGQVVSFDLMSEGGAVAVFSQKLGNL